MTKLFGLKLIKPIAAMMALALLLQIGSQLITATPVYAYLPVVHGTVISSVPRSVIQPSPVDIDVGEIQIGAPLFDIMIKELGVINLNASFSGTNVRSSDNSFANHNIDGSIVSVVDGSTTLGYAYIEYGIAKLILNESLFIPQGTNKVLTIRLKNQLPINGSNETNRYANLGILDPGQSISNPKISNATTLIVRPGTITPLNSQFINGVVGGQVYRKPMFRLTPQIQSDTGYNNLLSIVNTNEATLFTAVVSTQGGYYPEAVKIKQISFDISNQGVSVNNFKLKLNNETLGSGSARCTSILSGSKVVCEFEGMYQNGYTLNADTANRIDLVGDVGSTSSNSDSISVKLSTTSQDYGMYNVADAKNAGAGLIRSDIAEVSTPTTPRSRNWFTEAGVINNQDTTWNFSRGTEISSPIIIQRTDTGANTTITQGSTNISAIKTNLIITNPIFANKIRVLHTGNAIQQGAISAIKLYINNQFIDQVEYFTGANGYIDFNFTGAFYKGVNSIELKIDTNIQGSESTIGFLMANNLLVGGINLPSGSPINPQNIQGISIGSIFTIVAPTPTTTVFANITSVEQSTILASAASYPQTIGTFEVGGDINMFVSEITLVNLINNVTEVTNQTIINNLNTSTDGAVIELYYNNGLVGSAQLFSGLSYISLPQPIFIAAGAKANISVVIRTNGVISSAGDTNKKFKIGVLSPGTISSGFAQTLITTVSGEALGGDFNNLVFNDQYLRATTIVIADQSNTDSSSNNLLSIAGQNQATLFATNITANASKSATIKQINFTHTSNGVQASDFKLNVNNTVLSSSDAQCAQSGATIFCTFIGAYMNGLTIPAGASKKIELVANVSASTSYSDYVTTSINEGTPQNFMMYDAIGATVAGAAIVWSDNAAFGLTTDAVNWFTDAGIEKLPSNSWTFTRDSGSTNNEVVISNVQSYRVNTGSNQYMVNWSINKPSYVLVQIRGSQDEGGYSTITTTAKSVNQASININLPNGDYMVNLTPVDDLGTPIGGDVISTISHVLSTGSTTTGLIMIERSPEMVYEHVIVGTGGIQKAMQLNVQSMTNSQLRAITFTLEGLVNSNNVSVYLTNESGVQVSNKQGFDQNFKATVGLTGNNTGTTQLYNVILQIHGSINEAMTVSVTSNADFIGNQAIIDASLPIKSPIVRTTTNTVCTNGAINFPACNAVSIPTPRSVRVFASKPIACINGAINFPICTTPANSIPSTGETSITQMPTIEGEIRKTNNQPSLSKPSAIPQSSSPTVSVTINTDGSITVSQDQQKDTQSVTPSTSQPANVGNISESGLVDTQNTINTESNPAWTISTEMMQNISTVVQSIESTPFKARKMDTMIKNAITQAIKNQKNK